MRFRSSRHAALSLGAGLLAEENMEKDDNERSFQGFDLNSSRNYLQPGVGNCASPATDINNSPTTIPSSCLRFESSPLAGDGVWQVSGACGKRRAFGAPLP